MKINNKYIKYILLLVTLFLVLTGCGTNDKNLTQSKEEPIEPDNQLVTDGVKDEPSTSDKPSNVEGDMLVHFIDVGQADASLIEVDDYKILIDTGDWNANQVSDYLNSINVDKLDLIIITHPHADHIGQLDKVIKNFQVDEVWMNGESSNSQVFERALTAIENNDIDYYEPSLNEVFDIGELTLEILHPETLGLGTNDDSIVTKATFGELTILFTGDAELKAEKTMLSRGMDLQSTILHSGHHGSKTSSSQDFINAVNPEVSIISAGKQNKYGHPSKEVLDRYKNSNIKIYGTYDEGNILMKTDGVVYEINTSTGNNISQEVDIKNNSTSENEVFDTEPSNNGTKEDTDISEGSCIDINNSSKEELQNIIHIGDKRAEDIINGRPYTSVDDLIKVEGIAEGRLGDIKEQDLACAS